MKGVRRVADPTPGARGLTPRLIVIGGSLGGMQALERVLEPLPADFPVPIAATLHRHAQSNESLPRLLKEHTKLAVADAEDKLNIRPGTVVLAPAGYHLLVARGQFDLSVDDAVRYSRPSIDVLFESAADAYGPALIGVILTGANSDGTQGARRIRQCGGLVVAQDPATAEAPVMPQSAIAAGAVDRILPLEGIASFLIERSRLGAHHEDLR